ncbi:TPA: hypothetical protein NEG48_003083 [Elizabethkingia anophelis]|nr:hypothetical protein [Elizabethkingia anophelis]
MKLKTIALFCLLSMAVFQSCNKHKDSQINPADTELKAQKKLLKANGIHYDCATRDSFPNQDFGKMLAKNKSLLTTSDFCVNVAIHIVRESNGTGGFNAAFVDQIIQNLNDTYNLHDVYFYNAGVDYIDNSTYYDLDISSGNSSYNNLIATNHNANAINLYLVSRLYSGTNTYGGRAENIPSISAVIDQDAALLSSTQHEVGHCLNLFHTHSGRGCGDTGGCQEATDGSNCSTCGDFVCDTPADPCLFDNVDDLTCQYTGPSGFSPAVNNIMSYAPLECRNNLTPGQTFRFKSALLSASVLQPVKVSNCNLPSISGPDDICNFGVYTVNDMPSGATVNWTVSTVGQVTFSNITSNSITLTQIQGEYGNFQLRARVTSGGQTITVYKNISLPTPNVPTSIALNPASSSYLTWNTERNFAAGYTTTGPWKSIDQHPGVAEVDWKIYDYSTTPTSMITSFTKYNSTVTASAIYLWLHSNSSPYVIEIVCRAKDKCGQWGSWGPGSAYFIRQSCTSFMALDVTYDKKAKGHNIGFSSDYNNLRTILASNKKRHAKMTNDFDISIYNSSSDRIFHNEKATNPRIFLKGLTSGDYKIVLLQDGNSYEQTLNVK